MKKITIAFLAFLGLFAGAFIAQAQVSGSGFAYPGSFPCFTFSQSFGYGARDGWTGGGVSQLQQYLGITPTGYFGPLTRSKLQILQSTNGFPSTGYFGPMSRGWITRTVCNPNVPTPPPYPIYPPIYNQNQPPVINGGTFPTTLTVNQIGTWTVNASDPENGFLNYAVNWGDERQCGNYPYACGPLSASSAVQQSSTFTHVYSVPGTFTITFTVTDNAGLTAQTTTQVTVTGNSYNQQPMIYSISPTSGPIGTQVTITGSGFDSRSYVLIDGGVNGSSIASHDGTHLTFTIPNSVGAACNLFAVNGMCPQFARLITPGVHSIAVETISGTSNAVNFTVY